MRFNTQIMFIEHVNYTVPLWFYDIRDKKERFISHAN